MKQRIAILFLALLLLGCTGDFEHIDAEAYRTAPYTPAPTDAVNPDELPTLDVMTNAPQPTETPVPQPLRERYQIPETVRFDRQAGLLHIAGNPAVEVPDVALLPTGTVDTATFTQEDVDGMFAACLGERKTRDYPAEMGDYPRDTLNEMQETLDEWKALALNGDANRQHDIETRRIRALSANALSRDPYRVTTPKLWKDEVLCVTTPDELYGAAFAVQNRSGETSMAFVDRYASTIDVMLCDPAAYVCDVTKEAQAHGIRPPKLKLETDPHGAAEHVRSFLDRAGRTDFAIAGITLFQLPKRDAQWYLVTCKRLIGGVPVSTVYPNQENLRLAPESDLLDPAWAEEQLTVLVSDTGIRRVDWNHPIAEANVQAADLPLIPFAEVLEIFEAVIADYGKDTHIARTATVDRIALTMTVQDDPLSETGGTLVPVWSATFTCAADARPSEVAADMTIFLRADTGEVLLGDDPRSMTCDAAHLAALPRIPAAMTAMPRMPLYSR